MCAIRIYATAPGTGTAPAAGARAACVATIFLPSLLYRTRGGGARLRRPSRDRTLLIMSNAPGSLSRGDVPDNLSVDGARDAVLQLQVHLGNCILVKDGRLANVACRLLVPVVCLCVPVLEFRVTYG